MLSSGLGVSAALLYHGKSLDAGLPSMSTEEIKVLKKELKQLGEDNLILKKP